MKINELHGVKVLVKYNGKWWEVVIPRCDRKSVLQAIHGQLTGGMVLEETSVEVKDENH